MPCSIPVIHSQTLTVEFREWTLFYDRDDGEVLGKEFLLPSIGPLLKAPGLGNFRQQIHLETTPFLMAVDYERGQVSFLSPRAHRELFLLQQLQPSDLSSQEQALYRGLQEHVQRAQAMEVESFPSIVEKLTAARSLPDLSQGKWREAHGETETLSDSLEREVGNYRRSFFERCSDYGLVLVAKYDLIRIHLLKFVAMLSALDFDRGGAEVVRLLREALERFVRDGRSAAAKKVATTVPPPLGMIVLAKAVHVLLGFPPTRPLAFLVRWTVKLMAKRFIAGADIHKAEGELLKLMNSGRDATVDQLGELVVSAAEADEYRDKILQLIQFYGDFISPGERNGAGINAAHISIKVSALCHDFNPHAFDYTYGQVAPRLKEILEEANARQVFINIDAEHYEYRDGVFAIYRKLLLEEESLKDYQQTGIVVQAYLRDAHEHLLEVIELAKRRGHTMPIRLVKGAYWDAETVEARAHSYDAPEFINKWETDVHYRQLMIETLEHFPHVQLCLGGHNLRDHCYGEVLREKFFPHTPPIEHQCLHMTYEGLSVGMAKRGWVVRNYVPVGPLLVGMSYLVRRIMENSSQVGVLVQMRSSGKGREKASPQRSRERDAGSERVEDHFFNTPPVRLFLSGERESFERGRGKAMPPPPGETSREDVLKAVARSQEAFVERGGWADFSWAERASYLLAVARALLVKRVELAHLITSEAGKTVEEALGDVDEAVDFLNYYARAQSQNLIPPRHGPRGPVAVIAPWNFPLAIPCGMVGAALVAGNTVLLKSAEQTSRVAQFLVDLFHRAGLPPGVLSHLPGPGSTVGAALVESSQIAQVVFTGSLEVGMEIAKKCAGRTYHNRRSGRTYPVGVVTEMGGKNAIVVTASADLDEAVSGVLYSAYGHAGQKCSACSRVLVDERVARHFLLRFARASQDIAVGPADAPETWINPLISEGERERLLSLRNHIIREAQSYSGAVHVDRLQEAPAPHCVGPLVVELPGERAMNRDSFSQRELFAPVVHVMGYRGLSQAVEIFNATPYALTGGIYGQSQDDIDFLAARMECGNIYVNRSNTGARVGIEPFGGFKLSGTGPKAGGPSYVGAFTVGAEEGEPPGGEREGERSPPSQGGEPLGESRFSLAAPSILSPGERARFLGEGLERLLGRPESWGSVARNSQWRELGEFRQWLAGEGLEQTVGGERGNVPIPGQLSYCNFSLVKKRVVVVARNSPLDFRILLSGVAALAAGCGVTVVSDDPKAWAQWDQVGGEFVAAGLPPRNFRCREVSRRQLQWALGHAKVSVYLWDGHLRDWAELSSFLYPQGASVEHVKRVDHPRDLCGDHRFAQRVLQFVEVRAFAVNTMRYGAPLEWEG